jgi:hypothetical protein
MIPPIRNHLIPEPLHRTTSVLVGPWSVLGGR